LFCYCYCRSCRRRRRRHQHRHHHQLAVASVSAMAVVIVFIAFAIYFSISLSDEEMWRNAIKISGEIDFVAQTISFLFIFLLLANEFINFLPPNCLPFPCLFVSVGRMLSNECLSTRKVLRNPTKI